MSTRAQIVVLVVAVLALVAILWLVRRGSLKERFALLWLAIGGGIFALVLVRPWLDQLSDSLGIRSGTTTLFLAAILFLLGLILHLSVVISSLEEKVRDLAEAVALTEAEYLEARAAEVAPVAEADRPEPSGQPEPAIAPADERQHEA